MKSYFLIFLFFLLFFSCTSVKKKDSKVNFSKEIKHSNYLSIVKKKNYSLVIITNPDNENDTKKYALANDISNLKLQKNIIPIKTPLKSIVCLTGTDIGMLDKINSSDKIVGVTDIKYVYNEKVLLNSKKGKVLSVQDLSQFNPENLIGKTNVITYSGFGKSPANEDKLAKLGILCIPIYDWRETSALGKAEWIKLYGFLFEKEKNAYNYFEKLEKKYFKLIEVAKKYKSTKTVLSGSIIGDSWYMPAGESYNANLFRDANCTYVNAHSSGTGSSAYSFEKVLKENQHSDIWINPGFNSYNELFKANERYSYFSAYKNEKIYCYSHNMNFFWENAAIEPEKVLADLIQIFHSDPKTTKNLYFYKKIKK